MVIMMEYRWLGGENQQCAQYNGNGLRTWLDAVVHAEVSRKRQV